MPSAAPSLEVGLRGRPPRRTGRCPASPLWRRLEAPRSDRRRRRRGRRSARARAQAIAPATTSSDSRPPSPRSGAAAASRIGACGVPRPSATSLANARSAGAARRAAVAVGLRRAYRSALPGRRARRRPLRELLPQGRRSGRRPGAVAPPHGPQAARARSRPARSGSPGSTPTASGPRATRRRSAPTASRRPPAPTCASPRPRSGRAARRASCDPPRPRRALGPELRRPPRASPAPSLRAHVPGEAAAHEAAQPASRRPLQRDAVTIDGERIELDAWPGMVGHNWGAEHAERWIWIHGAGLRGRRARRLRRHRRRPDQDRAASRRPGSRTARSRSAARC